MQSNFFYNLLINQQPKVQSCWQKDAIVKLDMIIKKKSNIKSGKKIKSLYFNTLPRSVSYKDQISARRKFEEIFIEQSEGKID